MTTLIRESRETTVHVQLRVGGNENDAVDVNTTHDFLDHMLTTLARYAGLALHVEAAGDLRHHLVEDVAITIGRALREEIPEACVRYGHAVVPMDDALVEAAIDVGGRAWYDGTLPSSLFEHFFRSLAHNSESTLHLRVLRGRDRHHVIEAAFKALGLALRSALQPQGAIFSTKGAVVLRRDKND
jgi:imidazoleglycerol-phosphate dehydratase